MSEGPKSHSSQETHRPREETCRTWSDLVLLVVAMAALAFFLVNLFVYGTDVGDDPAFQAWSERVFFLLCATLALSAAVHARNAWREGVKRKGLPPTRDSTPIKERSFRTEGPARPLIQHCIAQFERTFRRFYAFHRIQPPYVAYFYYAKKGSLSLAGRAWTRTGFLLLFLVCAASLGRQGFPDLRVCELLVLGLGCLLVISGLLIRLTVSYQEVWVRIMEENNRVSLTLSLLGGRNRNRFERLYHTFTRNDGQSETVSCSTHSR